MCKFVYTTDCLNDEDGAASCDQTFRPHDDGPRLWLIAIALPWILLVHVSTGGIPRCAKHRVVGTLAKLPVALSVWLLLAVTAFVK